MSIKDAKILAGLGSAFLSVFFIPYIGILLSLIGLILLTIAIYKFSKIIPNKGIFVNFLIATVVFIVSFIVFLALAVEVGNEGIYADQTLTFYIILSLVGMVVGGFFLRKSFIPLAEATKKDLLKTGANILLFSTFLIFIGIGLLGIIAGWITVSIAFFTMPDKLPVEGQEDRGQTPQLQEANQQEG